MKRKIRGTVLVALGLTMIFSAVSMFAVYEREAEVAGENAQLLLEELRTEMESIQTPPASAQEPAEEPQKNTMVQTTLAGYDLVGILRIASIGLELPILNSWDYDLLKISPCRYSGSVQDANLILLGHNYKRHFAPLKKLSAGDKIVFQTVDGTEYSYKVAEKEVLQKTELERLTASEYDLTLFTCTNGGYSRLTIRCDRILDEI